MSCGWPVGGGPSEVHIQKEGANEYPEGMGA